MVIMRAAETEDKDLLETFLSKNQLLQLLGDGRNQDFILLLEGGQLLGCTRFKRLSEGYSAIEGIYVIPSERGMGLGDGLLRATLNYLQLQGFKNAILLSDKATEGFYLQEDLAYINQSKDYFKLVELAFYTIERLETSFYCDIDEFFSRKCKSSKGV